VLQPHAWVIVDNGSTDGTLVEAQRLAQRTSWIRVLQTDGRRSPTRGAPIAEALERGFIDELDGADILVKADADVSMEPDFFARLLHEFAAEPRLGIASGSRYELLRGIWQQRHLTATSVEAQCRAYRSTCLAAVLPFDKHRGWDGVDVYQAQLEGWRTLVVKDLPFRHHRPIGDRDGSRFRAWMGGGAAAYSMGYRPLYLLARSLYHARTEPAAIGLLAGYATAALRRNPRASRAVRSLVRRDQAATKLLVRSREVRGSWL
jgi:glycosyltransferase involved in cell wall biosynthesis